MQKLRADRRWAVTGTPIQNGLADLANLMSFLKLDPYADRAAFDTDITYPWKERNSELAIGRLKKLLSYIMLRRSKTTIELPPRKDVVEFLQFTPEERAVYSEARARTVRVLEHEIQNNAPSKGAYINALQRVNALRMICNLGQIAGTSALKAQNLQDISDTRQWPESPSTPEQGWTVDQAQEAFENLLTVGQAICSYCFEEVEELGNESQLLPTDDRPKPLLTQCLFLWCGKCSPTPTPFGQGITCGHTPPCLATPISTTQSSDTQEGLKVQLPAMVSELPTKIKALLSDLRTEGTVKSIVFSFWTSTLDIIAMALTQEGMEYARYDGKVAPNKRADIIKKFETDPSTNVLLLSISCGAVGLNLTAASRAYLMEPHWNPTVEDQALARIHRMGQTREVKTIRYIIKDTFEEHVIKVQNRKKDLAELLLSKKQPPRSELTLDRLRHLWSLLG